MYRLKSIAIINCFYKKLKNVNCEYNRLNGCNSTKRKLQAAWYIGRVRII